MKPRILFSVPTRHHVEIALDELDGLQELGYTCGQFSYAAKEGVTSTPGRLKVIVQNALSLIKTARQFKPDVIYLNSRLEALAGIRDFITISLFKTFYRQPVKFLLKSHGSDMAVLQSTKGTLQKLVLPYLRKNVTGWLFLSSEEKANIVDSGFLPADRVFVTKNIVRTNHFKKDPAFKAKLNVTESTQVLLFVGRLIPEKGINEVIEGFAKLPHNADVILIVVGWGTEEENLKKRCQELGINEKVIFTGFIPEQDVVSYYANSDILVFPTYFPEGFPMSLFNSVAAGLAVITTPTRAAADYLTEPVNCLWVEPQNSQSVYNAVQKLLNNPQLALSMRDNNVAKGESFSKKQVSLELAQIVNQSIKL
ncbi:glycosyltransferase family 4 protein [Mucilaginibacter sp. PAMB04168]|uniref:glycosyltransferase family 4 protein n=1 Tax=Mucilaginibacter sp. PAMB04168 TaxID=3138567 RepID=UPI0031F6DF36